MNIEISLKTKLKRKGAAKYVDNGYQYSTIYAMACGDDLCLKAHKGRGVNRNATRRINLIWDLQKRFYE